MAFKVLGGTDLNEIVNTILAKLMDNYLAVRYSFAGKQKKESFKDTFPTLVKAIISMYLYIFFYVKTTLLLDFTINGGS